MPLGLRKISMICSSNHFCCRGCAYLNEIWYPDLSPIMYVQGGHKCFFHSYGDITIAGEGLQNLGLCSTLGVFELWRIFIVPHLLWHRTLFFPVLSYFVKKMCCYNSFVCNISLEYSLWQDHSIGAKMFDLVTLTLVFDLLKEYCKGIVSKLMIKFWMSQKCGKMKDNN
jgi:hypothetical protein